MIRDDLKQCELCGGPLDALISGWSSGMYCAACDRWAVVTSYIPPIRLDRTTYRVLVTGDSQNKAHIRAIAQIAAVNFLRAREMLRQERWQVFAGEAEAVARVRDALTGAGIDVAIEPSFPW